MPKNILQFRFVFIVVNVIIVFKNNMIYAIQYDFTGYSMELIDNQ